MHIPAYPSRYTLWFRSECLVYWVAKMPFVFSHVEYCDMHFVYGFCKGNSRAAVVEYQRRFPDRRIPSRRVFTRIRQTLRDNGCFPSVSVSSVPRFCRLNNPCILVVMYTLIWESVGRQAGRQSDKPCDVTAQHSSVMYSTSNPMYNYYTHAKNFAVQINGFMSLTSYFDVKYRD